MRRLVVVVVLAVGGRCDGGVVSRVKLCHRLCQRGTAVAACLTRGERVGRCVRQARRACRRRQLDGCNLVTTTTVKDATGSGTTSTTFLGELATTSTTISTTTSSTLRASPTLQVSVLAVQDYLDPAGSRLCSEYFQGALLEFTGHNLMHSLPTGGVRIEPCDGPLLVPSDPVRQDFFSRVFPLVTIDAVGASQLCADTLPIPRDGTIRCVAFSGVRSGAWARALLYDAGRCGLRLPYGCYQPDPFQRCIPLPVRTPALECD